MANIFQPEHQYHFFPWFFLFMIVLSLLPCSTLADVGTAASYGPPYNPTACFNGDPGQFPADSLFAAVGEGIWDNGAACGREYIVRCLSSATPGACLADSTVRVLVLDRGTVLHSSPSANDTTIVLSKQAFRKISTLSAPVINVEFAVV
ncbi:EG45-like domain containing protein [Dioscorea cayenensis subsp. rotundata]|uniref:EG45-like domain containing protein n=1 Tax=Dioscorea cayennensis subsp. rotundata TaxID=55577 RepID=A0AB40ARK9_DIOCR|nr:EG45-like domain containing protein [Dioscorea cayenensis subsp. rotundata]